VLKLANLLCPRLFFRCCTDCPASYAHEPGRRYNFLSAQEQRKPSHDCCVAGSPPTRSPCRRLPHPPPLFPPSLANRGLVALDSALERLAQFLYMRTACSYQSIEALDRRSTRGSSKPPPVQRHAQNGHFQQATLRRTEQATGVSDGRPGVPTLAILALEPAVGQFVCPGATA